MDDVRAAAERVRRIRRGDGLEPVYPDFVSGQARVAAAHTDEALLADAYLAEHPADDGEPVTEDWLRSIGFKQYYESTEVVCLSVVVECHAIVAVHWPKKDGDRPYWSAQMFSMLQNAYPQTRGDVRRLCAALGVELKGG